MPLIRIKQLHERVATSGLFMGGTNARRKLEPGEIVEIKEDEMVEGENLFDMIWNTGMVDLVPDSQGPATRPLDYKDYREAKLCSPNFKPVSATEEREMLAARERVQQRMFQEQSAPPPVEADSPDVDAPSPPPKKKAARKAVAKKPAANRRAQRRAAAQEAQHGEANTT